MARKNNTLKKVAKSKAIDARMARELKKHVPGIKTLDSLEITGLVRALLAERKTRVEKTRAMNASARKASLAAKKEKLEKQLAALS
jgi:hypothetical protein